MKLAVAAPLLSQIAARDLYAQAATAIGRDPRQNVYTRLGVKTVINCRGTWTYLSGSLQFPEVRQARWKRHSISSTCWSCSARLAGACRS
jgi:L-seryl-tRNA(Ser) seleniumtransferase